jgi:hypothetical protein
LSAALSKARNASPALQVNPDLRLWIETDFFAAVKKSPQVQDDGLTQSGFVTIAHCNIVKFDVVGHGFPRVQRRDEMEQRSCVCADLDAELQPQILHFAAPFTMTVHGRRG